MQKVIIIKPAKNSNSGGVSYITREIYNDFPANGNLGVFYTSDVEGLGEDVGVNVAGDIEDLIVGGKDGRMAGKAYRVTITLEVIEEKELFTKIQK